MSWSPIPADTHGLAIGIGVNPWYGELDPQRMAHAVVDEAIRNVVAVGADPDKVALLDNFSWGDPRRPSTLGELVAAVRGCCEASLAHQAPFVSGKDSLNNEYLGADGARHSVPPTLVITAIAHVPDANAVVTPDLKHAGNVVVQVGATACEFGGSHFAKVHDVTGRATVPAPDPAAPARYRRLHQALRIRTCAARVTTSARAGWPSPWRRWQSPAASACRSTHFRDPTGVGAVQRIVEPVRVRAGTFRRCMVGRTARRTGHGARHRHRRSDAGPARRNADPPRQTRRRIRSAIVSRPTALVLAAAGTNRDHDVAFALDLAGAEPRITLLSELIERPSLLDDGQMVVIAGGFSYADALGAGRMFALQLEHRVGDMLRAFVAAKKPVIGICNGFQVLTRTGLLPGALGHNASGHFQCQWVTLETSPSRCIWTTRDRPRSTARSHTVKAGTRTPTASASRRRVRSRCGTPVGIPTGPSTTLPGSAIPAGWSLD